MREPPAITGISITPITVVRCGVHLFPCIAASVRRGPALPSATKTWATADMSPATRRTKLKTARRNAGISAGAFYGTRTDAPVEVLGASDRGIRVVPAGGH